MAFELPWWREGKGSTFSYLSKTRDDSYLARAYGKMAYASAGGYDTIWGKNNVPANINQGEFDTDDTDAGNGKTKKVTGETVYELVQGDKFRPKNHLVSINTSGYPETFGAIRKGSYTYKTYDGSLGKLPAIGSIKHMSWGWSYADQGIAGENFSGKVMGYNIQSNTDGGYDITVNLIGENSAVTIAGFSIDAVIDVDTPPQTDAAGNKYSVVDLFSAVEACTIEANNKPVGSTTFNNDIRGCVVSIPENYTEPDTSETTDNPPPMSKKAYVTFDSIVMLTNKLLKANTKGTQLLFAENYDSAPFDISILSANPLEVLLPGNSKYGTKDFKASVPEVPPAGTSYLTGDRIRLPNILISADYIGNCGKAAQSESTVGGTTKKTLSIKSFYDKLFDVINQNLGLPFSLTLTNSGDEKDANLYIADITNIRDIQATVISTVRSANLSAALDSDAQKQFFVLNRAPEEIKNNVVEAQKTSPKQAPDYSTLVANVGVKASSGNINALKSANKNKISAVLTTATNFGTSAPWNLSVVLDGSGGWKYGQRISYGMAAASQLIPPGYKIGFAISDIQHNVADGDWTVSLSTMCKVFS